MNYVDSEKSILLNQWEILFLESYQKEMINSTIPNTKVMKHPNGMVEYRLRTETFRQYLQVFVGLTKEEEHKVFFEELGLTEVMYNVNWFYTNQLKETNIIRLRKHDLNTLVHELTHFIGNMCSVIGCEMQEEIPAYIMEEVLCKLMILSNGKFKVDKRFYLE